MRALGAWACRYVPVDWAKNANYSTGWVLDGRENMREVASDCCEVSTKLLKSIERREMDRDDALNRGDAVAFIVGAET